MPSRKTNVIKIERKIADLESRDVRSDIAERDLKFHRLWREFAGRDVVLVVEPKGVISRGEPAKPKLVEVTDEIAADMLAYADVRSQRVRLATDEEAAAYRAFNARQTQLAKQRVIEQAAEHARVTVEQLLNIPRQVPGAPIGEATPPAPPEVQFTPPAEPLQIDLTELQEGATSGSVLADLGSEALVAKLTASGLSTVAEVAESSAAKLVEAGLKPAEAARVIARAAELVASRSAAA